MLVRIVALLTLTLAAPALANPPVASYIFPPGGQRGTTVPIKLGGLFLHESCPISLIGPGVQASPFLKRTETLWFDGPLLPLPESQQAEDYPQDMAGEIKIAPNAPLGLRYGRVWTSQGAAPHLKFVVGDLPEIVEKEIEGDPIPVLVKTPVTINGRIFPREDVDLWSFEARKGETFTCIVHAARLGSPLDARLEALDAKGRVLVENEDAHGVDPALHFTAPEDGVYQIRIRDSLMQGGQAYVYRLTITKGPVVERVFPLGGRQGTTLKLDLAGQNLKTASLDIAIPQDGASKDPWQPNLPGQNGSPIRLDIDDLPEFVEGRDVPKQPIPTPVILNGCIAQPGELDDWSISCKKGEALLIEMRAAQLGSPLDAVVRIVDAMGKELLRLDGDKSAAWSPTADGVFCVQVRDRFPSRGGAAFAYRLKIAPAQPDFKLVLRGDAVTVLRKNQTKITIGVLRQGGYKEPIAITVENLPAGVTALPITVAANQTAGELTLKADESAAIAGQEIRIIGTPTRNIDKDAKKPDAKAAPIEPPPALPPRIATVTTPRGEAPLDTLLLAVALPTPFVIKGDYDMGFAARGGLHRRTYKIERNGYEGPLEIRLADRQARHLQGVTGPTITVPAGQSEFLYEAFLPPWMETGRTCRVCVQGTGFLQDGDRQHRVVFSSLNANEQLIAVIGPGQLALDLARSSATLRPGQSVDIPIRVKRSQAWPGPVAVSLIAPRHLQGLTPDACVIPADQERGVLTLRAAANFTGPTVIPVILRATLTQGQQRVVAEAPLEVSTD